jgi:hypothetical protein
MSRTNSTALVTAELLQASAQPVLRAPRSVSPDETARGFGRQENQATSASVLALLT